MPVVLISNRQRCARPDVPRIRRLAAWLLGRAGRYAAGWADAELSIALVDDAGILPINERFLGHSAPTDVISFAYAPCPGRTLLSGEVVVNVQRALDEARRRRTDPSRELALYLAHGCLHLTGADDSTAAQRARMQRIQTGWLRQAQKEKMVERLLTEYGIASS